MSIKEIIQNALCDECSENKYCDILADRKKCVFLEVKGERFTQQIIFEIVQELEKIQNIYSGDIHAINLCIETIKKMGEV